MKRDNKIKKGTAVQACLFFLLFIALYGCYEDNATNLYPKTMEPGGQGCDTVNISYAHAVSEIFTQNCAIAGCHANGSSTGGYTLDNYSGVKSVVLSGRLIGAITHATGYAQMPKDAATLNDCQIGQIESWVNQGAQNN